MPCDQPPRAGEQILPGGMANAGRVVRVGDTVRRPPGPHTEAVHALLRHLERVGFAGAPRLLGVDELGRSVLTFVEGDVALPPYPRWVAGDALLDGVARLQRAYHDAVRGFRPPPGLDATLAAPPRPAGSGGRQPLVGHNDLCVENVVCRGGHAAAFIDFDFAAPTDPLWDVAVAARHWVPVRHPDDLDDARRGVDQLARFDRYLSGYGVAAGQRADVVALLGAFLRRALEQMRRRALAGQPAYAAVWRDGYAAANLRAQEWVRHTLVRG